MSGKTEKGGIYELDPTDVYIGDFHITMNKNMGNIDTAQLLQRMQDVRNDPSLTSEEAAERLQRIIYDLCMR